MPGVSHNDRVLASDIRKLTLKKIEKILLDDKYEKHSKSFQEQLILKLAGTVLPRLQEHTGDDGGAINAVITWEQPKQSLSPTVPESGAETSTIATKDGM